MWDVLDLKQHIALRVEEIATCLNWILIELALRELEFVCAIPRSIQLAMDSAEVGIISKIKVVI